MDKRHQDGFSQRLLVWVQPLMVIAAFAVCWMGFYVPRYVPGAPVKNQLVVIALYAVLLVSLERNYCALHAGLVRVSELIYSQALSIGMVNAVFYAALVVYCHQLLNTVPLILLLAVQGCLCVAWCLAANAIYFRTHQPPETVIIYHTDADLEKIRSIRYFAEHFDVRKEIRDPQDDIHWLMNELRGYEVVFVAGINATLRNGIVKFCVENGIKGYFVPHLGDIIMAGAEYMPMFSTPVMKVQRAASRTEYMVCKRLMDIVIALIGVIVTGPIMLVTACAIRLYDGGPALYRQIRLTKDGRQFAILKFRSMRIDAEKDGVARLASENDGRITPVGRFIRATRIDELPQLFNILRGDMSVVGPRPERPEIAEQYAQQMPEFALRLQVKAGLTGMAQVYGRYNTEPYSKLQMDLMYINDISLITDIRLIFATVKVLFMRESTQGIQAGATTAADAKTNRRRSA